MSGSGGCWFFVFDVWHLVSVVGILTFVVWMLVSAVCDVSVVCYNALWLVFVLVSGP